MEAIVIILPINSIFIHGDQSRRTKGNNYHSVKIAKPMATLEPRYCGLWIYIFPWAMSVKCRENHTFIYCTKSPNLLGICGLLRRSTPNQLQRVYKCIIGIQTTEPQTHLKPKTSTTTFVELRHQTFRTPS